MKLKNYLVYFEFFSGFYEDYFYKQFRSFNEKDAIIDVVSYFMNLDELNAKKYLVKNLGSNWTLKKFWHKMNLKFNNGTEGYTLIWIKKVDFDFCYV